MYFLIRDWTDKADEVRGPNDLHERSVLVAPAHAVTFAEYSRCIYSRPLLLLESFIYPEGKLNDKSPFYRRVHRARN